MLLAIGRPPYAFSQRAQTMYYLNTSIRDGAITLLRSNFNKLLITITNFYWNDNEEFMLFGNDNETEIELPERSQ